MSWPDLSWPAERAERAERAGGALSGDEALCKGSRVRGRSMGEKGLSGDETVAS